jgi:pimeloyl-ACP methyl ester carboxylesterase
VAPSDRGVLPHPPCGGLRPPRTRSVGSSALRLSHGPPAVDAHEVIEALGLSDITLVAHSMGYGVAFAYWDLYRDERLKRLVLIDEPPALSSQPDWPEGMAAQVGTPHTAEGLPTFTAANRDTAAAASAV